CHDRRAPDGGRASHLRRPRPSRARARLSRPGGVPLLHLRARSPSRDGGMTYVSHSGSIPRSRAKVLVVDDEPAIADIVSRYRERAGYETTVAATGKDALGYAEHGCPDVVVLDLMLPDIDGLEVMRRLRKENHKRAAIILLTARTEESDRITGLRLGADD